MEGHFFLKLFLLGGWRYWYNPPNLWYTFSGHMRGFTVNHIGSAFDKILCYRQKVWQTQILLSLYKDLCILPKRIKNDINTLSSLNIICLKSSSNLKNLIWQILLGAFSRSSGNEYNFVVVKIWHTSGTLVYMIGCTYIKHIHLCIHTYMKFAECRYVIS